MNGFGVLAVMVLMLLKQAPHLHCTEAVATAVLAVAVAVAVAMNTGGIMLIPHLFPCCLIPVARAARVVPEQRAIRAAL